MIKITSYYPFANLLRVTQEFFDDQCMVYTKSISAEHKETYSYDSIAEVSDQFSVSGSQQHFSWILLGILTPFTVFLHSYIHSIPALLYGFRAVYVFGIVVFVHSFFKHWYIKFIDKNGIVLTTINMTRRNRESVYRAIAIILSKSENIIENSITNPFPEIQPSFEHTYYDFTEIKKSLDKFYNERIIGLDNNFLSESIYSINYNSLSGKVFRGKFGIMVWQAVLSWAIFFMFVLLGLRYLFDFNIISSKPLLYLDLPLLVLSACLWPLTFVKRNVIGFYGVDGRIAYWAYVNEKDEEKFEQIVEFVQSRIPAENKEASPKESQ
jgi:hypothetical protein